MREFVTRHFQIDYADSVSLKPDTRGILRVNHCCTLNLQLRIICFYELLRLLRILPVTTAFFGFKGFIGCFEASSMHLNFSFVICLHCHNINKF